MRSQLNGQQQPASQELLRIFMFSDAEHEVQKSRVHGILLSDCSVCGDHPKAPVEDADGSVFTEHFSVAVGMTNSVLACLE